MSLYKHILVAVDCHADCDKHTIKKAQDLAKIMKAKISLTHAVEHINAYGVAEAYSAVLDVEEQMLIEAKKHLNKIGKKFGIPSTRLFLEVGSPQTAVLDRAKAIKADCLVVGSHGRHGFQLLLGSTANAILNHAHIDVLAVRVKSK